MVLKYLSLALLALPALAAPGWSISDGTVSVLGSSSSDIIESAPIFSGSEREPGREPAAAVVGPDSSLVVEAQLLLAGAGAAPHQAMLSLEKARPDGSVLQHVLPMKVTKAGAARVQLRHKTVPHQFLDGKPTALRLILGSFGADAAPLQQLIGTASLTAPAAAGGTAAASRPERYRREPVITASFPAEPRSPPAAVSLAAAAAVVATTFAFFAAWARAGVNGRKAAAAVRAAPVPNALFAAAVVGMEAALAAYYLSWRLSETVLALAVLGVVAALTAGPVMRGVGVVA